LFNEETFEITLSTLKDILGDIDKLTAYKDDDYWRLYEAIETFLYGELDMESPHEDGTFWGISNFSSVWEDMCSTYAFATFNVVYADTNIIFNGQRVANSRSAGHFPIFKKADFIDPFYIEFRGKKRWMRPDLVHTISSDEAENSTDWVFTKAIQIVIKRDNGVTVDFEVKLMDKKIIAMYQFFCSNLKKAKTQGSRVVGESSFRTYPKSEIEKQKNRIIDVYSRTYSKLSNTFRLLDWKYMDADCFIQDNKKVQTDTTKQLCYEFALRRLKLDSYFNSQFVIPWFHEEANDDIGELMDDATLHHRLRDNKLEVFKANFSKIQTAYLSHD
jgi:hypothetical protein